MNQIQKIERLLLKEFEMVPFHNLFMLNNKNNVASSLGGTCSDKVLHFKKVLNNNGIESKLHSAIINDKECHRMLSINIENKIYFIDVGSGWPSIKLFPEFEAIEYDVYGMSFKTVINNDNIVLYHKTDKDYKLMIKIPFIGKSENEIKNEIDKRFDDKSIYPFHNSLRFSKIINNNFYFLKGNRLRIYNENSITEKTLTLDEINKLITTTFKFDLNNLNYDFIG